MEYIKITNLKVEYQGEVLFQAPHLNVQDRQIVGLIGDNGVGKTTLVNIIAEKPTVFEVEGQVKRNCHTILVPQILNNSEQSGGEKEKAAIVRALLQINQTQNSLLILDEPTSNLDIEQQRWLIKALDSLKQPILLISHDQAFLSKLVNVIWQIKDQQVYEFKGTYDEYQQFLRAQEKRQNTEYFQKQVEIKRLRKDQREYEIRAKKSTKKKKSISWSDWKVKDSSGLEKSLFRKSTLLKRRITKAETTLKKPPVHQPITLGNIENMNLELSQKSSIVRFETQSVTLHKKQLFSITKELKIKGKEKIALTGKNGAGKSVFLAKLFHKKLAVWLNPQLKMGYFKQNMAQETEETATVKEVIYKNSIFNKTTTMQLLGDLHLQRSLDNRVSALSGGQLVCFKLAKVLLGEHNLLILDEPDNFLDISSINALEEFLRNYPFAVIVVSHDQKLLKDLNFTSWKIKNHKLITPSDFSSKENTKNANQISLLQFKLDQLISDPNASFTDIENISREINRISKKN